MELGWDSLWAQAVPRTAGRSCCFRGGCRLDQWFGTWPFGGLAASESLLEVFMLGRPRVVLARPDIVALTCSRLFGLSPGLRVVHSVDACPEVVIFFPWNIRKLEASLESLGYVVGRS